MSGIDLRRLAEPFPADDVEWRVSRAGMGRSGIYCKVLAYITARAIQARLDDVCGPENWVNEPPRYNELRPGIVSIACGITIRLDSQWLTKWDVAEPTNIEPAKGGFSGAMKRAGAQWGIGRYLYRLDETYAEVADKGGRGWNWAQLPEKIGGATYYWKTPTLPGWALPREPEHEVSADQLNQLKRAWRGKFAADVESPADLRSGFDRFVLSAVGEFPHNDSTCWTSDALRKCEQRISETEEADGVDSDVPFG